MKRWRCSSIRPVIEWNELRALVIRKLLLFAVANAENRGTSDVDSLVVRGCSIDNGPILKRWMARAMGRANRIQHRTSHVTIVVAE